MQRFRRIAITVPPRRFFHGVAWELFFIFKRALGELGLQTFEVPVEVFLSPDAGRLATLLDELRAFRPELAIGLPAGTYALLCRMPAARDGSQPNVFTDVLGIPTVCLWGFAPIDFADQLLVPLPAAPLDSKPGADASLRAVLNHPLLSHWSRDSWQTGIMQGLGFAPVDRVLHFGSPALPGFTSDAQETLTAPEANVAFIGNLYQDRPARAERELETLERDAIDSWLGDTSRSLWDIALGQIALLPPQPRRGLALNHDQTFFWRFMHDLIAHRGQTAVRLQRLAAARQPVAIYGNIEADAPGVPANLQFKSERFRFGPELAAAYRRHAVTLAVTNPGFVNGYSYNPALIFAAGGFALLDYKKDFVDAFGDLGEAVCYRNDDELAAKLDDLLSHPQKRRALAAAMRADIEANHQLDAVLTRCLQQTAGRFGNVAARKTTAASGKSATVLQDLLPALQTHPHWHAAQVERDVLEAVVTTAPDPWAYAAEIPLPPLPKTLDEPFVYLMLRVEAGRVGVCLIRTETGELLSEQLASPTAHAFAMTLELPRDVQTTVIFRNTVNQPSRVLLKEASLCTRPKPK